jgi:hypothetical protein
VLAKKVQRVLPAHREIRDLRVRMALMESLDRQVHLVRTGPILNLLFLSVQKPVRNVTRNYPKSSTRADTPTS